MNKILQSILLLLALLLPATALAYDFAVDGIYYNKTSSNTVEVTYKDNNYASYSGEVVIPSTVRYNNVTYTVTAIGDSAFYECIIAELTIPETVLHIGKCSFYYCSRITCLSIIPPSVSYDSFDENWYASSFPASPYGWDDSEDDSCRTSLILLFVSEEAYDNYYNSEWKDFFSYICYVGAGMTQEPLLINKDDETAEFVPVEGEMHTRYELYNGPSDGLISLCDWDEPEYCFDYTSTDNGRSVYILGYAFAIEEGKAPSDIVCGEILYYSYYDHLEDLLYTETWEEDEEFFDFVVDGVSYNILDDNTVEVASGVHVHLLRGNEYYMYFTVHNTIYWEDEEELDSNLKSYVERIGDYNSSRFIIPNTVTYNGKEYSVTAIAENAFSDFYHDYECEVLGYDDGCYPSVENSYYCAWESSCHFMSLSIPASITSIGGHKLDDFTDNLVITGEGEWAGVSLDVAVQRLDIASGITTIPGLKVNPREVYSYAAVPPTCDENTFTDYTGTLHVPESSLAAYFTAPYWCNFANIVGDAVELTGITINKDSAELLVGEQLTLSAAIQPNNASVDSIAWSSSDEAIATVVNGVVTAKGKGECDIIVTALVKRAICHLTVDEVLPTSITLNQESIMMEKDSTFAFVATIAPENATYQTVTWASSNNTIATVNSNGVITARCEGECDITATCKNLTAVCHVKVLDRFIYITLDQHRAKLLPNHILTLTPTVTPEPTDLVVTSTNASVAAARLANGKVQVVGVAPGRAIIKVSSADGKAFTDSCIVDVYTQVGDVNLDGFVKISDVTCMIDYLLGGNVSPFDVGNADMNYDDTVSIGDITALIDYLLSGETAVSTYETFTVNGVSFSMVRVAGGTFMMGATEEQGDDASYWEIPAHQVTLTSSYMIGETEVTQELWQAVMGTNPSMHTGDMQKPVEYVTWPQCQEFITQLNALTGQNFRLPTEAEWEFAARGGVRGHGYKYAGSNNVGDVAWYTGTTTHPVALLQPNELGLYDMSGNVDEWINDYWSMYTTEPQVDPTGPETGTNHPYRGGSWYGGATASRVSCRMYRSETFKRGTMGLRLAL